MSTEVVQVISYCYTNYPVDGSTGERAELVVIIGR